MSTSTAFLELNESDITQALCDVLVPRLKETILTRVWWTQKSSPKKCRWKDTPFSMEIIP